MYAGMILMNAKEHTSFTLEFCDRDERMQESFKFAGRITNISDTTIDAIGDHTVVIYITGETGSYDGAMAIAKAAGAILKAGGLGIKVETSGKAFDKDEWLGCLDNLEESDLYDMFVIPIRGADGSVYSCGMHNLGLKDTIVSNESVEDAVDLIRIFSFYQIVDKPTLKNKETFATAADAPSYVILDESDQPYKDHELFGNPFGMWRLQRR
jgi:hypothetical protein